MDVWNELSLTSDKKEAYDKMTANVDDFNNPRLEQAFQYINTVSYTHLTLPTKA